jgi:hypothetical protein
MFRVEMQSFCNVEAGSTYNNCCDLNGYNFIVIIPTKNIHALRKPQDFVTTPHCESNPEGSIQYSSHFITNFFKIYFNIIFPYTLRSTLEYRGCRVVSATNLHGH